VNLDALGNIGDFLGGVGVIVTLIYLAARVRQNNVQLRSNAANLVRLGSESINDGGSFTTVERLPEPLPE
jgi:hypothetical protein